MLPEQTSSNNAFAIREVAIMSSVRFLFSLSTLKCNPRQGLAQAVNYSTDWTGGNGMIPRRLGRVAIISSIGGLRPTSLGLPAGGVVDNRLLSLRKHCFFSYRLLVAVAAGGRMLKDGKHKHLAADARALHLHHGRLCGVLHCLASGYRVGEADVWMRLGASGRSFRETRARPERPAFDAAA